jgi:hypothetical protein
MVATPHNHNIDSDDLDADEIPGVKFVTPEEARKIFDRRARMELGISGEEFLRRWDAGEYDQIPDTPDGWKIARLSMILNFAR